MSAQASIAQLHSPLKELVTGAVAEITSAFGRTEKDQAEVAEWITNVASGTVGKPEDLKDLDAQLVPRTYVVSNYLTAADVAVYGALHPVFSQLQPPQYYSHPALTRYFDHIQTRPPVRIAADALSPAFSPVAFDFEHSPAIERKADAPRKKEKKEKTPAPVPDESSSTAAAEDIGAGTVSTPAPEEAKTQKKEKKEKEKKPAAPAKEGGKKKDAGGKKPAEPEGSGEPLPSMIDLRVGKILDIQVHPDADGLYIEQIDFGEETGPRTVVSGLVKYIPIEQMRDKTLVGVCNLKPANMRGVKSFAMVLCATHKDGKEAGIELVQPPSNSKVGDRIYFEGYEDATPLSQLNPKKKIFETIQPGFTTLETKEAAWVNPETKNVHRIRSSQGVCVAPTFIGASLS